MRVAKGAAFFGSLSAAAPSRRTLSGASAPARCGVDEGRDKDERALKDVLIGLRQPEKCDSAQDFGQEQRADRGPDERAAAPSQTGAAEHYRRNARKGVVSTLSGVSDADLSHQHHCPQSGEERTSNVAKNGDPVDP